MRIACTCDYYQVTDSYYIDKEDSYKHAMERMAQDGDEVTFYAISQHCSDGLAHNGVRYEYATTHEGMIEKMLHRSPEAFILSGFGAPINEHVCKHFPRARKILIFVGGAIYKPREQVDYVMIASEAMRQELARKGFPQDRIQPSAFTVDTQAFSPVTGEKKWDVIYCADWRQNKRQELLLDALALCKGVTCLFLGAQNGLYNRDYWQTTELKRRALGDRITCIDRVRGKDMPPYYQQSRIGIHLGLPTEGGARSPIEAMACGLPVIVTTDCLSNTSRISTAEGVWTEPHQQAISDAIISLLHSPQFEAMSGAARARACREYYYDRMYEDFRRMLNGGEK